MLILADLFRFVNTFFVSLHPLFVIVSLVTHGDFLLPDLLPEFSVYVHLHSSLPLTLLLEDPAHVVEETSGRQHDRGRFQAVPAAQEELSVAVALSG